MKCKIFCVYGSHTRLEHHINEWLEEVGNIDIVLYEQIIYKGDQVLITIFYRDYHLTNV